MSRKGNRSDSLELLLDTICNMFGGILFIALLVVILLQMSGDRLEASRRESGEVSLGVLSDLQRTMQGLHSELQRMREVKHGQDRTLAALAPMELAPLIDERDAAVERREQMTLERDGMQNAIAETAAEIQQIDLELRQTDAALTSVREDIAQLELELERRRNARRRGIYSPLLKASYGKSPMGLVVQYGRVYVWHNYDRSGNRLGLNLDDFLVVERRSGGVLTTPRPTAGTILDGSAQSSQVVERLLRQFPSRLFYAEVVVRPDSYGEFRHLQSVLVALGLEYRLIPISDQQLIVDRGGSESRVQ